MIRMRGVNLGRRDALQRLSRPIARPACATCLPILTTPLISSSIITPARAHSGHSHAHHSHGGLLDKVIGTPHQHTEHLEPLFGDKTSADQGQRITILGFLSNVVLAGVKAFAGVHFHSEALVADAGHSVSDVLSDIVTFSTIYLSTLSPSPRFPYGRASLDSIGGLAVSGLLFSGSLAMGWHSLKGILHPEAVEADLLAPAALVVAVGTIVSKELLFRYTLREAKRTGQTVLVASAWHHRSDSLCTAVALVGIAGSLYTQAYWIDPLAGVLVSGIILRASIANSIRPIQGLLGYAPSLSEPLSTLIDECSTLDPTFTIKDRFLQVHGGRMDVHLRALVEQPDLPWSDVQKGLANLSKHIQDRLDERMDDLPEGKLTVQLTLDEVKPH